MTRKQPRAKPKQKKPPDKPDITNPDELPWEEWTRPNFRDWGEGEAER